MSIEELGSIGELVAAVATVLTLAYLAMQIRQSASATKANIRQAIAELQLGFLNTRSSDPVIRSAVSKMRNGEKMTSEEEIALRFNIHSHIRTFENYYVQHSMGTLSNDDWAGMRASIKREFHNQQYRDAFVIDESIWNPKFRTVINEIITEIHVEDDSPGTR